MISEQEQSLIERYQQQLLSEEDKVLFIKKIMEITVHLQSYIWKRSFEEVKGRYGNQ